jgi:ketol-acid reductoisomerase
MIVVLIAFSHGYQIVYLMIGVKPRKPQNVALIAVSHGWRGL